MWQFHFNFYCFFRVFGKIFWFSRSLNSSFQALFFLWTKFLFLASCCSHAEFWNWFSDSKHEFCSDFFGTLFRIHSLSVLGLFFVHSITQFWWILSKETGFTEKARSLSHWELGYQSSSECLLADIGIKLISVQFRSWIKYSFRI